ncbi:MAG: NDP-sugar synthase [Candidatus Micrarchaeota archaeon]
MRPDYVILAAGHGKRLWPISESTCKPMARVLEKPVVEWIVSGVLPHANKLVLVIGQKKEQVVERFRSKPYADKIKFVEQPEQKGTGHAVLQAENAVESDSFVVVNGDNFFTPSVFPLVANECAKGGWFAVTPRVADRSRYGAYAVENGFVKKVMEKTEKGPGLININLFHAPKSFFELLKQLKPSVRGELEVTDALQQFFSQEKVRAVELKGYFNDIGAYWDYLDANAYACQEIMPAKILGTVEDGAHVNAKLFLGKGSVIKGGALVEGNCFIGENCVVGRGAELRGNTVVESNCTIGAAEVNSSVIMRNSRVADGVEMGFSVLCEDVHVDKNSKLACKRPDGKTVTAKLNGTELDSHRAELGSVIGRGVHLGESSRIAAGALVTVR